MNKKLNLSVIINSYGRAPHFVKRCLESILNQEYLPNEILIIDQNDQPLLEDFKTTLVKHLHYPNKKISAARNQGAKYAQGEWLWFIDDDAFSTKTFLSKFHELISKNLNLELIAGSILIENSNNYYSLRHLQGGDLENFLGSKLLMGGNFLIKKATFFQLGCFDEHFGIGSQIPSSEDTDLVWRAHFNSIPMKFDSRLAVYHSAPIEMSLEKATAYGYGKGALVKKWIFRKFSLVVWYELIEMLLVPIIKIVLQPKHFKLHTSILFARIKGLMFA